MGRRLYRGLLLPVLCTATTALMAEPSVNLQTQFYPVSGSDSASIHHSIQQKGPIGRDGKRFHAYTHWQVKWNYRWIESQSQCSLTQLEVGVDIKYLLPELESIATVPQSLRDDWNRYYRALFQHEQQHRDYGLQAAAELEQTLNAIGPRPCTVLENEIDTAAQQLLDRYHRLEQAFDRETNHGINQGVALP